MPLFAERNCDYTAADLHPEAPNIADDIALVLADITALPFADRSFDYVFVSHVLEHVDDDEMAAREVLRVLRPGGVLVAQHPWDPERERTFYDPSVTTAEERRRVYGQKDHVRIYGHDRADVLRRAGFSVRELESRYGPGTSIDEAVRSYL